MVPESHSRSFIENMCCTLLPTAPNLYCFRVECAAHNTASSTPTSSCINPNVIVSMAGRPMNASALKRICSAECNFYSNKKNSDARYCPLFSSLIYGAIFKTVRYDVGFMINGILGSLVSITCEYPDMLSSMH